MRELESHSYRIQDMAIAERPRERLAQLGAESLTTAELMAILLRSGRAGENVLHLAERLLHQFGGLPGLHRIDFVELCAVKGIGPAKAAQLKAALAMGNRLQAADPQSRPSIQSPQDAANLVLYEMSALEQEQLRVLLLNTRNHLIAQETVYQGSLNNTPVRTAEMFRAAIRRNAAAIIVVHNHPSGDPTPSPEDVNITRHLVEVGKLLDIAVLDHLVIGQNRFVSLKERHLGFS